MTDAQLYLSAGLPSIAVLVGILVNAGYFVSLNSRISRLEEMMGILTGKAAGIGNRVIRIEHKLGIPPR